MIYISEFLPNPSGSDVEGEWIELWNGGPAPVSLSGWVLVTKGDKRYAINGRTIGAGDYLLLPRKETKLTLHNTDGALALYNSLGKLADEVFFIGTAPEGKSFSRTGQMSGIPPEARLAKGGSGQLFAFADPTPGTENIFPQNTELALVAQNFPVGQVLNPPLGTLQLVGIAFGGAAVLAMLLLVALKKHEDLSKLFFGRDKTFWQ